VIYTTETWHIKEINILLEIENLKGSVYFIIQLYYLIISAMVTVQLEIRLFVENKMLYLGPNSTLDVLNCGW